MEHQYIKRNLGFAHFGNGLVVYDKLHEEHGDYQRVAHINRDRSVEYYVELEPHHQSEIEFKAKYCDPSVSPTQTWMKVFEERPQWPIG